MKLRLPSLLLLSLLTFLVASVAFVTNGYALDKTPTGFYYPTGVVQYSKCGTWLGRDTAHDGCYFDEEYHIGVDLMATVGDPVYPIADGTITAISSSGWGTGNVGVVVRHKLASGGEFLALYGHIVTSKNVGDPVTGGVSFAQIGSWPDGDHLHFGIHPGLTMPATNWGKMPNASWPDTNGFVDPIDYINNHSPLGDLTSGLVGHWTFDNCDATDSSGNGNNGVMKGNFVCNDGVSGKAVRFSGTEKILFGDIFNFGVSDFSVSFWINIDHDEYGNSIISKRNRCGFGNFYDIRLQSFEVGVVAEWCQYDYNENNTNYYCDSLGHPTVSMSH